MFELDQKVSTPKGIGYVSYVEDGYIEVEVAGNEIGFEAPYKGVSTDLTVNAPKIEKKPPEYFDIVIPETIQRIGQMQHTIMAVTAVAIGGSVEPWDKLSNEQKLNYVAVGMGWKNAEQAVEKIKMEEL